MSRGTWSDVELGYIQDHWGDALADVATSLGRSYQAVVKARARIKQGITPARTSWSASELEDLHRYAPYLTDKQLMDRIPGRTLSSIRNAVKAAGIRRAVDYHARSPHIPGKRRTLLARTCPKCGLLLPGRFFFSGGKAKRNTVCKDCRNERQTPRDEAWHEKKLAQSRAFAEKMQSLTTPHADRHGYEYTADDDDVLSDATLPAIVKALTLGRSYRAVVNAMHKRGYHSPQYLGAGARQQWIIDNPNLDRLDEILTAITPSTGTAHRHAWDWDDDLEEAS